MSLLSRNTRRSLRITQFHAPAIWDSNRVHMFTSHSLLDPKRCHTYSRPRRSARVERLESLLRRRIFYRVAHACHTKKVVTILVQLKVVSNGIVGNTTMILCPRRLDKPGFSVIRAQYPGGEQNLRIMSGPH